MTKIIHFTVMRVSILFLNNSKAVFVDPESGKILWDYSDIEYNIPIPVPTVLDEHHVFLTGGYNNGSVLLEVSRNGDTFSAKEVFRLKEEGSHRSHGRAGFVSVDHRPEESACCI